MVSPFQCEECTGGTFRSMVESSVLNVLVLVLNTVSIMFTNALGPDEEVNWNDKFK